MYKLESRLSYFLVVGFLSIVLYSVIVLLVIFINYMFYAVLAMFHWVIIIISFCKPRWGLFEWKAVSKYNHSSPGGVMTPAL